jgi:MFS-type transporter involved in bile tolerance (Atg22 family)
MLGRSADDRRRFEPVTSPPTAPDELTSAPRGWLAALGLHRPELRAWAMYDWANSAMVTTIIAAVFPIFFTKVSAAGLPPAQATKYLAAATTVGMVFIALLSPVLGTLADARPIKKRLLAWFMGLGVGAVGAMFFLQRGQWVFAAMLFVLANIGANGSFVFYDSLLPHIARPDEVDRVSTAGYALGYVGGGLLLVANLLWIQKPEWFGLPYGSDLRLMSTESGVGGIPKSGKKLVIIADVKGVLYIRMFDARGKVVLDKDETRLTEKAGPVADLKRQLKSLWPPHELASSEKDSVIAAVTSIVGHTLPFGPGLTPAQASLPARLAFLSVAVWWLVFSFPLFRSVPEPPQDPAALAAAAAADGDPTFNLLTDAFARLAVTLRDLRRFRHGFLMLLAFLIYNDGIGTIYRMATSYGESIGIDSTAMIAALVLVQFVGIPFAFAFGSLAGKIGAKRSIVMGLLAYVGICVLGYFMKTATHFFLLAILVGMVQGGTQALSRSLFASMIPRDRSGEFFGFFAVVEKFAGIFGPLLFYLAIEVSGDTRHAILTVIPFFIVGVALLALVDVKTGQQEARAAEALPDAVS